MVTLSSIFVHPLMTCFYGILGGAIVSFWLIKWQMKKQAQESNIKILHDAEDPIDIGSGLTSLFPDVQLYYKNEKIDYKIKYITGTIMNNDKKRTVTTFNLPFELILPKKCKVLEAKILESPKEEIKVENKGYIVEISTPLTFLPQEEIEYCILYKSPDDVDFGITLETRIADVDVISTEYVEDKYDTFERRYYYFLSRFFIYMTLAIGIVIATIFMILPDSEIIGNLTNLLIISVPSMFIFSIVHYIKERYNL